MAYQCFDEHTKNAIETELLESALDKPLDWMTSHQLDEAFQYLSTTSRQVASSVVRTPVAITFTDVCIDWY